MEIQFAGKASSNALVIHPVFEKGAAEKSGGPALEKILRQLRAEKEFEGKDGQLLFLFGAEGMPEKTLLVGLGEAKKLIVSGVMANMGAAVKTAAAHRGKRMAILLSKELQPFAQAIVEAGALAAYQPALPYKSGEAGKKLLEQRVETVELVSSARNAKTAASADLGAALAQTANEIRDWVNAPPNIANAAFFDKKAAEIAKQSGAHLTILRKKEIEKLGMGALLGVNRGSLQEARLTILDYMPRGASSKKPLVFVGKGILFDSGGYNLKPRGSIEDMQLDKAGAATVLALIKLLPKIGMKRRVIAVAPFTENLIGESAMKPSEIIKTYSGKTIEITNTDAEGRLVLADAIAYAIDKYQPEFVVDLATLTGACMIALGDRYAGLFANDEKLAKALRAAGDATDELLWPLPLHKDFSEKIKGQYADLRNADLGFERYAGASKGAAFIQEFVGKTKWAHLDIAGPAFTNDPKKYESKGATGFGLRLLIRFLQGF